MYHENLTILLCQHQGSACLNVKNVLFTFNVFISIFEQLNRLWRKSRSRTSDRTCYGVDLNRNFDYRWGGMKLILILLILSAFFYIIK